MSKQQNVFPFKHIESFKISKKYRSGGNLIYDCQAKFFACVSKIDAKDCQKKYRAETLLKKISFSCRILKSFSGMNECGKKQQELILKQGQSTIAQLCQNSLN